MEEMKKNPWTDTGRLERQMDPVERARMLLKKKIDDSSAKMEKEKVEKKSLLRASKDVSERNELQQDLDDIDTELARVYFCEQLLGRLDSTLREHGKLDGDGKFESTLQAFPSLRVRLLIQHDLTATPDDIREAAQKITDIYPEVHFEFQQSLEALEFTAMLGPAKSSE